MDQLNKNDGMGLTAYLKGIETIIIPGICHFLMIMNGKMAKGERIISNHLQNMDLHGMKIFLIENGALTLTSILLWETNLFGKKLGKI